jgi:hypothetical protein
MNPLKVLLLLCISMYLLIYQTRFYYYFLVLLIPYYFITQHLLVKDKKLVTPKKKSFISMWTHPYDPQIYGTLKLNITKLETLLSEYSKKVGHEITVTDFLLKVLGEMIKNFSFLNGNILFGKFLSRETIDVSLDVPTENGRGMEIITLKSVDTMSLAEIKKEVEYMKEKLTNGVDKMHNRRFFIAKTFEAL